MSDYFRIMQDLKSSKYAPVYFLQGEETYFIDQISNYIEKHALTESEKSFNQTILFGKESDFKLVLDSVSRVPMMANYQVVILKEAQSMRSLKDLEGYIKKPFPSSILVICHKHKKIDMRTGFGKAVKANSVFLNATKLYENKVPDFVTKMIQELGFSIDYRALMLLVEYLGSDLSKIANELNKLIINLKPGEEISGEHIEKNIGISKDYNVFELQRALGQKDVQKTFKIFKYLADNIRSNPLIVTISVLFNFYKKLLILKQSAHLSEKEILSRLSLGSPFFLKEYKTAANHYSEPEIIQCIHTLRNFDLRSKGVNNAHTAPEELLKEMQFHLMYPKLV